MKPIVRKGLSLFEIVSFQSLNLIFAFVGHDKQFNYFYLFAA